MTLSSTAVERGLPEPVSLVHSLAYPLNLYARVVELEEGHVDYLHYGLHEFPGVAMPQAQQRATELLEALLPPPGNPESPCRILEVGIGLGTTLARLQNAGYRIFGITPDAGQIAVAHMRQGEMLPLACTRLEDFAEDAGAWDVLLLQESAQYIDPLDLFTQADRLLSEEGEIVLADEFALRREESGQENLHLLDHFIALADRFGFAVVERRDVGVEAAPTVDYLLRAVARHADVLKSELGIDDDALDALNASNRLYQERYAAGRFGYTLLKLKRKSRPQWRLGRIGSDNAEAMRALFAEVFCKDMSAAHWQWKYGEGRGDAVGVWEQDTLIAHYGGVSRNILYFGKPECAAQSGDVMVARQARGTLSRQGPLFLAAATYLEQALGFGARHLLGFGFPNERAWRMPAHLGLYGGPVGKMVELVWTVQRGRLALLTAVRQLAPGQAGQREEVDACWTAMASELGHMIVGVRDAATLEQRYVQHPETRYALYAVRQRITGKTLGVFVLGPQTDGRCELLDVVAPLRHIPLLVHHARRVAAHMGAQELFMWATRNIAAHFGDGAAISDLDINVPANIWTAAPQVSTLQDKWWLTGGDTDFH